MRPIAGFASPRFVLLHDIFTMRILKWVIGLMLLGAIFSLHWFGLVVGLVAVAIGIFALVKHQEPIVGTHRAETPSSTLPFLRRGQTEETATYPTANEPTNNESKLKSSLANRNVSIILVVIGALLSVFSFVGVANTSTPTTNTASQPASVSQSSGKSEAQRKAEDSAKQAQAETEAAAQKAQQVEAQRVADEQTRKQAEADEAAKQAEAQRIANEQAAAQKAEEQRQAEAAAAAEAQRAAEVARAQEARNAAAQNAPAAEDPSLPLKAICGDNTTSYQDNASLPNYRGMCSGHGGIGQKLGRVG